MVVVVTNFQKSTSNFLSLSPNLRFPFPGKRWGGGCQFPTFDTESKFAKISNIFAEKFSKFLSKKYAESRRPGQLQVARLQSISEPQ